MVKKTKRKKREDGEGHEETKICERERRDNKGEEKKRRKNSKEKVLCSHSNINQQSVWFLCFMAYQPSWVI